MTRLSTKLHSTMILVTALSLLMSCVTSSTSKRKQNKPSDQGETISGYISAGEAGEVTEGSATITMKSGILSRDARVQIKTQEIPITDEASAHLGSIDGTAVNIEFVDPTSGEILGDDVLSDSYQYSKSFDDLTSAEGIHAVIVSHPGTASQSTTVLNPGEFDFSSGNGLRLAASLVVTLNLATTNVQVWFGSTTSPNKITRRSSSSGTGSIESGGENTLNLATPGKIFVINPNSARSMTARNLDGNEVEVIKYGKGTYEHLFPIYDATNDRLFFVAEGGTKSANQFSIMRYELANQKFSEVFTGFRTGNSNVVVGDIKALSLSPDGNHLFFATQTNQYKIFKLDANAVGQTLGEAVISQMSVDFYAMAVSNSKIFWADENEMRSANYDGSSAVQLSTHLNLIVTSLALDTTNQKIYQLFKSNPAGYIRRIDFDGNGYTFLFNLQTGDYAPTHLNFDSTSQKFYYCNMISPPTIRSVDLDGSNARTGANSSQWDCSNGFALDRSRMKLYQNGLSGSYADSGNFGSSTTPAQLLPDALTTPVTVQLVEADQPFLVGWDGDCSLHTYASDGMQQSPFVTQICSNPPSFGYAGIRPGYSSGKSYLAWSALQPGSAGALNLIPNANPDTADIPFNLNNQLSSFGGFSSGNSATGSSVAVNPLTGNIFYGLNDSSGNFNLYKLSADGSQFNLLKTLEASQVSGVHRNMVIDPTKNKIFIRELDSIAVINTDGTGYGRVITDDNATTPNWGLAVEPTNGWLYYAKKRSDADIFDLNRSNLDGSESTNLGPQDIGADSGFYVTSP